MYSGSTSTFQNAIYFFSNQGKFRNINDSEVNIYILDQINELLPFLISRKLVKLLDLSIYLICHSAYLLNGMYQSLRDCGCAYLTKRGNSQMG